jgi:hypothetical protein
MAFLFAILNVLSDHQKSVWERGGQDWHHARDLPIDRRERIRQTPRTSLGRYAPSRGAPESAACAEPGRPMHEIHLPPPALLIALRTVEHDHFSST